MLADFDFRIRQPTGRLGDAIESVWFAQGTVPYEREAISPTGSTVVVLVLGDPIGYTAGGGPELVTGEGFVAGPHDRPAINAPRGQTHAIGIVTRPTGCAPVVGRPPSLLRGRVADVTEVWPLGSVLRTHVLGLDPEVALDAIVERLEHSVSPHDRRRARCARWVARLELEPTLPIASLANVAGLTPAHLTHEFTVHVGLTPRVLARLLRMRAVLAAIDIEPDAPWTEIAHRHGWFDQAHFIRDFKRHTGVTPTVYVDRQRRSFAPGQAASDTGVGFVPEI
ncbi:MAG: AraC family transcriptional regulator [Actinomycetota bacterium]